MERERPSLTFWGTSGDMLHEITCFRTASGVVSHPGSRPISLAAHPLAADEVIVPTAMPVIVGAIRRCHQLSVNL